MILLDPKLNRGRAPVAKLGGDPSGVGSSTSARARALRGRRGHDEESRLLPCSARAQALRRMGSSPWCGTQRRWLEVEGVRMLAAAGRRCARRAIRRSPTEDQATTGTRGSREEITIPRTSERPRVRCPIHWTPRSAWGKQTPRSPFAGAAARPRCDHSTFRPHIHRGAPGGSSVGGREVQRAARRPRGGKGSPRQRNADAYVRDYLFLSAELVRLSHHSKSRSTPFMAKSTNNPFAQALDQRIRSIVEETVEETVRNVIREELSQLLGSTSAAAPAPASAPATKRRGRPPGKTATKAARSTKSKAAGTSAGARPCNVVGCKRPYRSQGYCAAHYQSARKHGWPMPAPDNFVAPPSAPRGRPPKKKSA